MMATQIAHWPGKDTPVCDEHLKKLVGLGAIMGFGLTWSPCEPTACTNCESDDAYVARLQKRELAACETLPAESTESSPLTGP